MIWSVDLPNFSPSPERIGTPDSEIMDRLSIIAMPPLLTAFITPPMADSICGASPPAATIALPTLSRMPTASLPSMPA